MAFFESERIRSHFGTLRLYGVTVEIIGDIAKRLPEGRWEAPVDLDAHARFVDAHGLRLPLLALAYEAQAYRTLGRTQTTELLERSSPRTVRLSDGQLSQLRSSDTATGGGASRARIEPVA